MQKLDRKIKVIFLDVDGVLNGAAYFDNLPKDTLLDSINFVSRECVARLAKIQNSTQAKLVLTSSWRTMFNEEMLPTTKDAQALTTLLSDFDMRLFDKTDQLSGKRRGNEVRKWLNEHPEVSNFVILDDAPFDDWHELADYWLQINFITGLVDNDIISAIDLLNQK